MGFFSNRSNKLDNKDLIRAIDRRDTNAVARLLEQGANPNFYSDSGNDYPLGHAARQNAPEIVSLLLKAGADPTKFDCRKSFFTIAREHENKAAFLQLCTDLGPRIAINNDGLHFSREGVATCISIDNKDLDFAIPLLEGGAVFGTNSEKMKSALMHAATKKNDLRSLQCLLDHGVSIDIRANDETYNTPLHTALEHERYHSVELLLKAGADTALKNGRGLSALELAETRGNKPIAALFGIKDRPVEEVRHDGWILLSPNRVACVTHEKALGRKITDIFNFATAERSYTMENTRTRTETLVLKSFAEMPDKAAVIAAFEQLQALGGTATPESIYSIPRKKEPLMKPQAGA